MTDQDILKQAEQWLASSFDQETRDAVQALIDNDPKGLKEAFYKNLEFGTGGMRGIMGVGTNRINKYTLGKNTQGISNYLKKQYPNKDLSVAIAYDCRHNSDSLARLVANIFTANNIKVYLFESLRPTPELSFAVRHLDCDTGIVLTASHNPPEYNGYKVYNNVGAQIVPPEDGQIISEINAVAFDSIKFEANTDLLEVIGAEVDKAFIEAAVKNGTFGKKDRNKLKIVFTSLHGTSIKIIPDALKAGGYTDVHIVEEQREPDGDFPTVKSPNPEEPAALKMAMELAEKIDADIVIGTDPDSDRIGIAVRGLDGKITLLNGNQTMTLMSNYLIQQWKKAKKINGKQFIGSTIVSTNLVRDIAHSNGVACKIGLTGFKWIAKMIHDHSDLEFIGGGEESFGYMVGDFVRDKDAVTATLLACEIATDAKEKGNTLLDELIKIYIDYDFYKEHLISVVKKGIQGQEIIKKMMVKFRENPPKVIDKSKIIYIEDYAKSERLNTITNEIEEITVPKSNVLIFYTADGTKVAVRPSGTEPKIKFYFSIKKPLKTKDDFRAIEKEIDSKIYRISKQFNPRK
jgi:phosphoglucomutase